MTGTERLHYWWLRTVTITFKAACVLLAAFWVATMLALFIWSGIHLWKVVLG